MSEFEAVNESAGTSIVIAAQTGGYARVPAGHHVRITDIEGRQVGDFFAVAATRPDDWMSVSQTRNVIERLVPRPGDQLLSASGAPLLEFVLDNSPGLHDWLYPPCDRIYYDAAGLPGHPNCRDNFGAAAAEAGYPAPHVPEPLNLFQNSLPDPTRDWAIDVLTAQTAPGDHVVFRAIEDVVVVLTACSVDDHATNDFRCTPLRLDVYP